MSSGGPSATTLTPACAAFRPEIDDPVSGLDDVEVVLDDDDGIAVIAQAVQERAAGRSIS
jgi:hypothetical protein